MVGLQGSVGWSGFCSQEAYAVGELDSNEIEIAAVQNYNRIQKLIYIVLLALIYSVSS